MILKNVKIWTKDELLAAHIVIDEEKGIICKVSKSFSSLKFKNEKVIDLKKKLVIPSLVDIHSHLRDFEESSKETYESGAEAAAAGGFSHVFDMPNKRPPITSSHYIKEIEQKTRKINKVSIFPFLLLNEMSERPYIFSYPFVKAYLGLTTGNYLTKFTELQKFIVRSKNIVTVHCEDTKLIEANERKYLDKVKHHCEIRSPETELVIVDRVINMLKKLDYKAKIHIAHVTLTEVVERLVRAEVSFEVTPHHLLLNTKDYEQLGVWGKMNPPLRLKYEQEKLWNSFLRGKIPIIATDHAPHTKEEKINDYLSGVPGFETALASILSRLQPLDKYKLDLVVKAMCLNPRKLMQIQNSGIIVPNGVADLTVIDMNRSKKVNEDQLKSKCGWSPWEGKILKGWPVMTIHKGNISYDGL